MIKSFLSGSTWIIIGNFLSRIAALLSISALSYLLNPDELGIYSLFINFIIYLDTFSTFGIAISLQRILSQEADDGDVVRKKVQTGITSHVFITFWIAILLAVLHKTVINSLFNNTISFNQYMLSIGIFFFQSLSSLLIKIFIGFKKFRLYSIRTFIFSLSSLLLATIGGYFYGINGVIIGYAISVLFSFFVGVYFLTKISRESGLALKPNFFFHRTYAREIWNEGFMYYVGNTLMTSLVGFATIKLLIQHVTLSEIAYVKVAQSLSSIIGFLPLSLTPVTIAFLSSINEKKRSHIAKIKSLQLRSVFCFTFFVIAALSFFLPNVVGFIFSNDYLKGEEIYLYYFAYTFIDILSNLFVSYLVSAGMSRKMVYIGTVTTIIQIATVIWLLPIYGVYGYLYGLILGKSICLLWLLYEDKSSVLKEMLQSISLFIPGVILIVWFDGSESFWLKALVFMIFMLISTGIIFKILIYKDEKKRIEVAFKNIIRR